MHQMENIREVKDVHGIEEMDGMKIQRPSVAGQCTPLAQRADATPGANTTPKVIICQRLSVTDCRCCHVTGYGWPGNQVNKQPNTL